MMLFLLFFAGDLTIKCIANEGVLLERDGVRIMIDGLFHEDFDSYFSLTAKDQKNLESARSPFDRVDLLLATHMHADHFRAQSVGNYLQASPETLFWGPPQTVEQLRRDPRFPSMAGRITAISVPWYQSETRSVAGFTVRALAMKHGANRSKVEIQNHSWVVTLGDKNILHLGDADTDSANYKPFDWKELDIDVALVPFWFLRSGWGSRLIRETIKPERVVAIHLPRNAIEEVRSDLAQKWPQAILLYRFQQKIVLP